MKPVDAEQYMECVRLLAENGFTFDAAGDIIDYSPEDFEVVDSDLSSIVVLDKCLGVCAEETESVGIFPNAIADAYENNLISNEEDFVEY